MPQKKPLGRRKPSAKKPPQKAATPPPRTQPRTPPPNGKAAGRDWDELAEKASARFEETAQKATDAAKKAGEEAKRIALDLGEGFDSAFGKLKAEADHMVKRGQHTRVRLKFRGKQIAELPVAVVAAAELGSLLWAGPLRLILAHVVGKAVLDVEFVNDAQSHVAAGKSFLSSGDLDDAVREFDRALEMDKKCAGAHLGKGIAFKLRGDKESARKCFMQAEENDPRGEAGREARRHLDNLA